MKPFDMYTELLISNIRYQLLNFETDEERLNLLFMIRLGFCIHCGAISERCQCTNELK